MWEQLTALNEQLFFFFNGAIKHPVNDLWLGYSTHLGNAAVLFPLATVVLWLYERKAFWHNVTYLAVAGVVGGIAVTEAKLLFDAPRPLALYHDAIQAGMVSINVMFEPLYAHSFPSGHSQAAFTVAYSLGQLCTRWGAVGRVTFYATASVIALSRVYVGAHFPADVLAGAVLGIATASASFWLLRKVHQWRAAKTAQTLEAISENILRS